MTGIEPPDFTDPGFRADPYPFYSRLRAEAPVHRVKLAFWLPVWLVTRYDDVLVVLRDKRFSKDFFTRIPFMPGPFYRVLVNLDPPDHTRLRALVNKAFTPRVVEQMRDRIQGLCDELLDKGPVDGRMDLVRDFALPLPLTVIADLMGIPAEDRPRFNAWSKGVMALTSGAVVGMLRALPSMWQLIRYFRRLVALRRAEPRDDFVSALVQAEEAGDRLSEDELVAMLALLLMAGYETTVNLIAGGALALVQNPGQKDLLLKDPSLAEPAIEEILRYANPVFYTTPFVAREGVTLGGVTIPRGAVVVPVLGSANRDESQFSDPAALDVTRDPNRHLAFGMGAHFCLGAPLARLEGRIALTTLFRRFPDLRLNGPAESIRWRLGASRGPEELPVALK